MNSLSRRRKLHKAQDGAAMIVVVCVLMVVMLLCLTLIVGAYQTMSSVGDGARDVSDYQQAKSLSDVLKGRITCSDETVPAAATDLVSYIRKFAADTTNFTDGDGNEIEGGPVAELYASSGGTGYENVRILLNKKKVSATKSTLFVVVMAENSDKKIMSTVKSGYDVAVSEVTDPGDGAVTKKMSMTFRAYY